VGTTCDDFSDLPCAVALPANLLAIQVQSGAKHAVALCVVDLSLCGESAAAAPRSRVFAWGEGASGQLGSGVTTFSKVPLEVTALKNQSVSRLVCGARWTLVVTRSQSLSHVVTRALTAVKGLGSHPKSRKGGQVGPARGGGEEGDRARVYFWGSTVNTPFEWKGVRKVGQGGKNGVVSEPQEIAQSALAYLDLPLPLLDLSPKPHDFTTLLHTHIYTRLSLSRTPTPHDGEGRGGDHQALALILTQVMPIGDFNRKSARQLTFEKGYQAHPSVAKEEEDTVDGMPGTAVVVQETGRRGGEWARSDGNGKVLTLNLVIPPNPATYLTEVEKARFAGTVATPHLPPPSAPSRLNTGVTVVGGWGEGDQPGEGDVLMFGSHVPLVTPRSRMPVRGLASSGCRWGASILSRAGGWGEVGRVTQCEPELNGLHSKIVAAHDGSTGRCVNARANPRYFAEDMALSAPTSPVTFDTEGEDLLETLLSPLRNNYLSPLLYRNCSPSPLEFPNGDDGEEGMKWRGERENGGNPAPRGRVRQQPWQVYLCVCVCECECICLFFCLRFFRFRVCCPWRVEGGLSMAVCAID
jgi:hypothetical protein